MEAEYRRMLAYDEPELPELTIGIDGQSVTFEAVPKEPEDRGRRDLPNMLFYPSTGGWVQPEEAIKRAVKEKAGRYGDLDLPYVVAVNATGTFADAWSIERALYQGAERLAGLPPMREYGVWMGPAGPINTRLTGVLVTQVSSPFHVGRGEARLYLNPWAQTPCPTVLSRLPTGAFSEGRVSQATGLSLSEIFNLPPEWPEETEEG